MANIERPVVSDEAIDQAIDWHNRVNDPGADEQVWLAFATWLEADEAHRHAYDMLEEVEAVLSELPRNEFIASAQTPPNLLLFDRSTKPPSPFRAAPWIAGAALAAAALVLFLSTRTSAPDVTQYSTAFGEVKTLVLPDGTRIEMNSNTRLSIHDGAESRSVAFDYGEAFFQVVSDPARPFRVTVGDRVVRDIGTSFDIVHSGGVLTVSVTEGRVGVDSRAGVAPGTSLALSARQRLVHVDGTPTSTVESITPGEAVAWRHGYLVYHDAPLEAVVRDLMRYFPARISLDGSGVAQQRFSGVLKLDTEDAMLNRISRFLPVTVVHQADGIIALHPSNTNR